MNRKTAFVWIFLIILGFISTDFITNFFILACLWSGILILGCTTMFKYGWSINKYLCIYWTVTLIVGTVTAAFQYLSIKNGTPLLPFKHISTIFMVIIGMNFLITTIYSQIIYFAPTGLLMLLGAFPLDRVYMSFPATTYGILISIVLIGYIFLSYLTPFDTKMLGVKYFEANGIDVEHFDQIHKFKCGNCGYTYEGYDKLNECLRCHTGSDSFLDVD